MIAESCRLATNRLALGARLCGGKGAPPKAFGAALQNVVARCGWSPTQPRSGDVSRKSPFRFLRAHRDHESIELPFVANHLPTIPPLPAGEGRGEGESFECQRAIRPWRLAMFGESCSPCHVCALLIFLLFLASPIFGQSVPATSSPPAHYDAPLLQCANLVYAGSQSSVCFSDHFLEDVGRDTNLRVKPGFTPVRLDSDDLFNYPFCVMSGNDNFSLSQKERKQLRQYLMAGGFLLASPGCSDKQWDASFRQEIKLCFPEYQLTKIPMTHPIFSIVNSITRLVDKYGNPVYIEGLEINGRLVMVYSKEGLNDVAHAEGCCCCGGNEIQDPALVNVNVFTYAALY